MLKEKINHISIFIFLLIFVNATYAGIWRPFVSRECAESFQEVEKGLVEACIRESDNNACRVWDDGQDCPYGWGNSYRLDYWRGDSQNNNGSSSNNTCNPINIATGNKYYQKNDYLGEHLTLSRFYNSYENKWSFDYTQSMVIPFDEINTSATYSNYSYVSGVGDKLVMKNTGKVVSFLAGQDGNTFTPPSHEKYSLIRTGSGFELTSDMNVVEHYNLNGQLVRIDEVGEPPILLDYEPGRIIVSKTGSQIILIADGEHGNIVRAVLPDGASVEYRYNQGLDLRYVLTETIYADSSNKIVSKESYLYENENFRSYVTGIEDENNNRISSVQYDNQGRAISSEKGPLGSGIERTQIQYNADGTRTVTNALGKQSTYHFTQFNGEYKITQVEGHASANCTGANQAYNYDSNGFLASKTDWQGNVTTYTHNDRGQETSRTEASGTAQARTITTEWHTEFNLPTRIIELERETVMTYDTQGRLLSRDVRDKEN